MDEKTKSMLGKALLRSAEDGMSADFTQRVMLRVRRQAERRCRRENTLLLVILICLSLALITGGLFAASRLKGMTVPELFGTIRFSVGDSMLLWLFVYAAVLFLAFMGLDSWLQRNRKQAADIG